MVHKMQRMALSSHQLVAPAASAAEKADSENTRNSDNNGDPEEEDQQGDWITHQHNWTKLNRKQDWETHATHTNTENTHTKGWAGSNTRGRGKTHRACVYVNILSCGRWRDMSSTFTDANAFTPDKKRHSLVQVLCDNFLLARLNWIFSASIQRDSSQPTDEAAGSEQQ